MLVVSRNLIIDPPATIKTLTNKVTNSPMASSSRGAADLVAQRVVNPKTATKKAVIPVPSKATRKVNNLLTSRIIRVETDKNQEIRNQNQVIMTHPTRMRNPAAVKREPAVTKNKAMRIPMELVIQNIKVIKPAIPKIQKMKVTARKETKVKTMTPKAVRPLTAETLKIRMAKPVMLTGHSQAPHLLHNKIVTAGKPANRAPNTMGKLSNASGIF